MRILTLMKLCISFSFLFQFLEAFLSLSETHGTTSFIYC